MFKKLFGAKAVVIDTADLKLPDTVQTDVSGIALKLASGGQKVQIEIVGESFRAENIEAIAEASQGSEFDIYLIPEPQNQYDKKAVAVYAANLHIGYIAKPDNRQWFKWVNEAFERQELLWGVGRTVKRTGTNNTGVFGSIYMPKTGKDVDELIPQALAESALSKWIDKAITLANTAIEPETITQARSLSKKAMAIAVPLGAHAKFMTSMSNDQDPSVWEELLQTCDSILDTNREVAYSSDEMDVDVVGSIEELGKWAMQMQQQKRSGAFGTTTD